MITIHDFNSFMLISWKKEKLTNEDQEEIKKFYWKIITYQDWNTFYWFLTWEDTSGINGIKRAYEITNLLWTPTDVFNSLFSLWILSDWKKGIIHPLLEPYVINFLQQTKDKTHIEYVMDLFNNISKIKETWIRKLKEFKEEKRR